MKSSVQYLIILSIFVLNYCGRTNTVNISDFEPQGEVDDLTTFTVQFSEALAPAAKQNEWLNDEFIQFDPPIQGRFKWLDSKTLIFSPDMPLQPIQNYTAKITNKVLFESGYSPDFDSFEFYTPEFDVLKVEFFWTQLPNENYTISLQANIHFNYPVLPDMLNKYLKAEIQNEEWSDLLVVSDKSSEIIAVNFGEIQQTNKKQNLELTVLSGLSSIFGKKVLADDRAFENELPPLTELALTDVVAGFDGTTGWIEIGTTQMVNEKQLQKYVNINPGKNLKYFVNENQFRIEGDFENAQSIDLKINKGLPGLYGGKLEFDFERVVSLANLSPSINYSDRSGKYLLMGGEHNLSVNVVNVDETEIEISQVYKNNLIHFLNQYGYYYDYDYYRPEYYVGNYGKLLYTEKVDLRSKRNWLQEINVNLDKALNQQYKGIFVATVRSSNDRWINASKMVAVSDMGIIARMSREEMVVFVNSLKTTEPVPNAEVTILSTNNQTLFTGKTGEDGVIKFTETGKETEGFEPRLIVAEKGEDFNYIDLYETRLETSRYDVGGVEQIVPSHKVFIYSDRDLYRPGESVNLSAVFRNDKMESITGLPVILKIITPTGKIFDEYKKNLNEEGSFELKINFPEFAQTGSYSAEIYTGSGMLVGSYRFSIEEFVPDKIRLEVSGEGDKARPGESVFFNLNAEYLFGAPAAGLNYQCELQFRARPYRSSNFTDFDFSKVSSAKNDFESLYIEGYLDENGKSRISFSLPADIKWTGVVEGIVFVSVTDLTGRTITRFETIEIYPKEYFTGIRSGGYYFGTDQNLNFQFIAVDIHDKPLRQFKSKVQLIRYEWRTVLKKDQSDRFYYGSEEKENLEWERDLVINGAPGDLKFSVSKSGKYELRIYKAGEEEFSSSFFYAYGWASSAASSFPVDKEGRVEILTNKERYNPGEEAKILFTAPFDGKLLVTMERNGVINYRYVNVENNSAEINIPVIKEYLPNVYISATLFKEHSIDRNTPFLVGHGYKSLRVEDMDNKLPVQIEMPQKIKPLSTHEVRITTAPEKDIFITLAAVDEGILQIKGFKSPDPYAFMYGKQPLKVEGYDLYKLLLPEILAISSSPGGDMLAKELKRRTVPLTAQRFNLLSFWSGIRKTDSNGEVKIALDIPQFNGEVRLMAVAYNGIRFGSGEKFIRVADDIILEPQLPRILSIKDKITVPVSILNTTNKAGEIGIKMEVEGPLKIDSPSELKTQLDPNSSARVEFELTASEMTGKAKISITSNGMAEVSQKTEIAVRPVSPLVSFTGSGVINGDEEVSLDIPGNFLNGTQATQLTISKFPAVQFAKQLKDLVGYPHGCIEQTVSRLFPQLYYRDLAKLVAPEYFKNNNPSYYVNEGIKKIASMQLYDGSLSYWQGGTESNWWGSVYAAHFLLEAKKAGYKVPGSLISNLISFLSNRVKEKSTFDYTTYTANRRTVKKIASKEILYSLYILAMDGKSDMATMNYYYGRPHLLSRDTKYFLAGAYALAGKRNIYNKILPENFIPEQTQRLTGGSFDSEFRSNAIMLNVLLEIEPCNEQIPYIIRYLTKNSDELYSTQDKAFTLLALGKAAQRYSDTNVKIGISVKGTEVGTYEGTDLNLSDDVLNGEKIVLRSEGTGEVFYFWFTEGVQTGKKIKEEDANLKIRRAFLDYRTSREITDNKFRQGQLVLTKISLTGFQRSAENVVITDMIPAGFEIENPRLSTTRNIADSERNIMNVDFMDIRDDRLILFTKLQANRTVDFYYLQRVVNIGEFQLPVISAEAMYDKEFHSYNGAGKVVVSEN